MRFYQENCIKKFVYFLNNFLKFYQQLYFEAPQRVRKSFAQVTDLVPTHGPDHIEKILQLFHYLLLIVVAIATAKTIASTVKRKPRHKP